MSYLCFLRRAICLLALAGSAVAAVPGEPEPTEAEAQYRLAFRYFVEVDSPDSELASEEAARLAAKWFRRAAEQGHAGAQCNMGLCYKWGLGVPQSDSQAVKWFHRAAEQGEAQAQRFLAEMYEEGQGVEQSFAEAEKWYRLSAALGDVSAAEALQKLPEKARRAAERAAAKNAEAADESSIDIEL